MECDSVEEETLPGVQDAGEDRDGSYRATMVDQQAGEPGMCWRNPLVYGPPQFHCRVKGCDNALFSSRGGRPWELCEEHHTCKFVLEFEEDNREGASSSGEGPVRSSVCAVRSDQATGGVQGWHCVTKDAWLWHMQRVSVKSTGQEQEGGAVGDAAEGMPPWHKCAGASALGSCPHKRGNQQARIQAMPG